MTKLCRHRSCNYAGDFDVQVGSGASGDRRCGCGEQCGRLGVYVTGDKPVPINCFISRFDINSGVATATTLVLDTPDTTVAGAGSINFGTEKLMLKLTPYNKSFSAISLRAPVDIGGSFAKPDFHLETGKLISRLGAALGLGVIFPPAALLPLVDTGLGENNACSKAYAANPAAAQPSSGSSTKR